MRYDRTRLKNYCSLGKSGYRARKSEIIVHDVKMYVNISTNFRYFNNLFKESAWV